MTTADMRKRRNGLRRRLFKVVQERDANQRALDRAPSGRYCDQLRANVKEYGGDAEDCLRAIAELDVNIEEGKGVMA